MAKVIPIPIGPIYTGGPCRGLVHVIQKGDTLYRLGKQYHVSVTQLMFANPFVDVYNLQIGDELCIPATIQPRQDGSMQEGSSGRAGSRRAGQGMRQEMPAPSEGMWDTEPDGERAEAQESRYLRYPIERESPMTESLSGETERK